MTGSGPLRADEPTQLGMYRLTAFLGEGGQGIVYLGNGPSGRKVAVKVLQARLAGDDKARSRFLREVEAVKRVAEFCVARVIDSDFNADRPYIVSEFVEGVSLQEAVVTDGPRERGGLERLAIGTATALVAIHQAGIVHRQLGGRPIAVSAGEDKTVRVWDLTTSRPIGGPLTGHTDSVLTIALTRVGNRTVAVTGSDDNGIRAWDLGAHKPLGAPFTGHTDSVEAVTGTGLGRYPVLVSAG